MTVAATTSKTSILAQQWAELRQAEPNLRIRDAASRLDVSEAELLVTQLGDTVTRLHGPWTDVLKAVPTLGHMMALTRNDAVVIEREGTYAEPSFFEQGPHTIGQVLGPDIDLRLFMHQWAYGFAVQNSDAPKAQYSLQFFDAHGEALHKIYLREQDKLPAFEDIVNTFRAEEQSAELNVKPKLELPLFAENPEADVPALLDGWAALTDTHQFFGLLRKHNVPRLQACRGAQGRFSWQVDTAVLRTALEQARDTGLSIMAFVGNEGCIEIHTGPVKKLAAMGPWYNVLDPRFNLHVNESKIAEAYLVEKPTSDGTVSSIEFYDVFGRLVLQLFGERKPGKPELAGWRQIIAALKSRA
jgi:putative hemin transport protein